MTVMNQVFRVRAPSTTYAEALADEFVRLNCMEEIIRGRRTLLMKAADLDDMTIAEQEEARKYASSEASETIPNTHRVIARLVDDKNRPKWMIQRCGSNSEINILLPAQPTRTVQAPTPARAAATTQEATPAERSEPRQSQRGGFDPGAFRSRGFPRVRYGLRSD